MKNRNLNIEYIVKIYKYLYPSLISDEATIDVVDANVARCCMEVETERFKNRTPMYSISVMELLAKKITETN
ncbi:hypothetical protein JCM30760_26070 [Thiomicrorhabdus hydrogeniphila]